MVLEVTVKRMKSLNGDGKESNTADPRYHWRVSDRYEIFTVHVGEQRILTIFTLSDAVTAKWVSDVRKAYQNKKGPLVVGVSVQRESKYYCGSRSKDRPFDVMALCIGSHCLIYNLPEGRYYSGGYSTSDEVPRALKDFLADSNTICVGMDMGSVGKKLEKDQSLEVCRPADVRVLALKELDELRGYYLNATYLQNLSLDEITVKLLGKEMDVDRLTMTDYWQDKGSGDFEMNRHDAKYLTLDAFFCHEMGVRFLDSVTKISSKTK